VQNDEGGGLGGLFAGGSTSAFGSRAGNFLTRATTVLGALFLVISFGMALMNRSPAGTGVERAGRAMLPEAGTEWFLEDEAPPVLFDFDLFTFPDDDPDD
jgi:preprotein translocase subunit SecG